jgi:hypothetical protein
MIPAIAFAYENIELDIMERMPRNSKRDHLVNIKLISYAYLNVGIAEAVAGFYLYFLVLNDYGIRPKTLFWISHREGVSPKDTDVYDWTNSNPKAPYGNTNVLSHDAKRRALSWEYMSDGDVDIRLFYY